MFDSKELAEVANKISLTLNGLESVKLQGRNMIAVRDRLKTFHQQISAAQENCDPIPFPIAELEKYPKLQRRLNTIGQRNPAHIEDTALLKLLIESLVVECNKSIALAKKYLKNPEATLAQVGKQTSKTTKSTTQSRTHSSPSQPTRSPKPPVKTQTTRTRGRTNPITTPKPPKQRSRQFTSTQWLEGLTIAIAIGSVGTVFGLIWGQSQQALGLGMIVGLTLGLGAGLVLTQSSRHHSQGAGGFLSLPSWQSLVGSVLVAIAIGAIVNPTVSLFYARRIGLEPWHPNYPQVGASPGIKLYSDLPFPEQDAKIQRFLENFRATVGARFLAPGPESCSVDVYLLRRESNYNAIVQTFHASTPFGFFTTVPGQPTLFVRDGSGLGTLTHEMMHHFLYCTFPSTLPTWVDEGVATLMEKFIAIELNGKLAFSWGYRSNWRDPEVRDVIMGTVDLTAALEAGRDQSLFQALFLMLYHQNLLEPLLTQFQTKSDETGIPTLMATLNLSMLEIQQQLQTWMQTEALDLPMLERSFVAWANETKPVNQYLSQNWQWQTEKQMWLSPQPNLSATIPSKEEILSYR